MNLKETCRNIWLNPRDSFWEGTQISEETKFLWQNKIWQLLLLVQASGIMGLHVIHTPSTTVILNEHLENFWKSTRPK